MRANGRSAPGDGHRADERAARFHDLRRAVEVVGRAALRFDADGVLHIDAKAAKDVVVNAGTAKVALHGDSTAGHTHTIPSLQVVNGVTPIGTTTVGTTGTSTDNSW